MKIKLPFCKRYIQIRIVSKVRIFPTIISVLVKEPIGGTVKSIRVNGSAMIENDEEYIHTVVTLQDILTSMIDEAR